MASKDKQHVVPRVYLKHWKIAEDKSFVYGIDLSHKYKRGVQRFGLNESVFWQERYYNDYSFQNPYAIEDFLGKEIEPLYEDIMKAVNLEDLSQDVREKIIHWLYFTQMRSSSVRSNIDYRTFGIIKAIHCDQNGSFSVEAEEEIKKYSSKSAKERQLDKFSDEQEFEYSMNKHFNVLTSKCWLILKSSSEYQFWTNDNPGFSPNVVERLAENKPYHNIMEMNKDSVIFYPMSPKYCLVMQPFPEGTPVDINALNMEIKFGQASMRMIDYINRGVAYTCNKVVISNNKDILERCIVRP